MAYSNKFVLSILVDGRICKEMDNGTIAIPFGAEYSVRLRNKHNRRAVAKIFVDGENISGSGYVVPSNGFIDIERYHDVSTHLKFVALDSAEAIDFGKNGPNPQKTKGVVEVQFSLEKEYNWNHYYPYYPGTYFVGTNRPVTLRGRSWGHPGTKGFGGPSYGGAVNTTSMNASLNADVETDSFEFNESYEPEALMSSSHTPDLQDGATVQGSHSNQRFSSVHIDVEPEATSIKVFLQGFDPSQRYEFQAPVQRSESYRKAITGEKTSSSVIDKLREENEKMLLEIEQLKQEKIKKELEQLRQELK